jgi:hypothetical protein
MANEPLLEKLTAEELATWLTVTETMAEAQAAYGSFELAANTIASRLKVHALRTGADFAGIEGSGKLSEAPVEISPRHWALWTRPTDPDFWKTGELHLTLPLDERRGRVEIFGYYGVKFEPVALRALLASIPKPPPGLDGKVTVEELATWLSIDQARRLAEVSLGISESSSIDAVLDRVQGGLIRAAATTSSIKEEGGVPQPKRDPVLIPLATWRYYMPSVSNFYRGEASFSWRSPPPSHRSITFDCYGIKLHPDDVAEQFPPPSEAATGTSQSPAPDESRPTPGQSLTPAKGGRRPAWWREPVLIELAGQLHDLELEPKILADLERAAADWLSKQGEYPGERTVRMVVTPLWERISKRGKNPKG